MSLDLNKLANKLDEALSNETTETLTKFLNDKRMSNNKQSMKLYTEEEVLKGIVLARLHEYSHSREELLGLLTPIELPSDEEIERQSEWLDNPLERLNYKSGIKWMRDKIQGGNNVNVI